MNLYLILIISIILNAIFSAPICFSYTGLQQSYTVPASQTIIFVKLWGGGGGGGTDIFTSPVSYGGGAGNWHDLNIRNLAWFKYF